MPGTYISPGALSFCMCVYLESLRNCSCVIVCECVCVCDALKALLAMAVEMLHCPTLLSGDSDGEVNG